MTDGWELLQASTVEGSANEAGSAPGVTDEGSADVHELIAPSSTHVRPHDTGASVFMRPLPAGVYGTAVHGPPSSLPSPCLRVLSTTGGSVASGPVHEANLGRVLTSMTRSGPIQDLLSTGLLGATLSGNGALGLLGPQPSLALQEAQDDEADRLAQQLSPVQPSEDCIGSRQRVHFQLEDRERASSGREAEGGGTGPHSPPQAPHPHPHTAMRRIQRSLSGIASFFSRSKAGHEEGDSSSTVVMTREEVLP